MLNQNNSFKKVGGTLLAILFATAIACNRATQVAVPPTFSTPVPSTSVFIPSTTHTESFVPGDPTATPLGSEIMDPNFIKGVAAYNAKQYEEAVSLMNAVIQSNPNLAPPYRYRGISSWYLNDCSSALKDFEKALSINPDYAAAWAGRGLANSCFDNWDQALKDYQKALSIDPSLAFVHHNLGVYYYGQGDYERSLEEYSLSAAIDPNRASALSGKAEAYTKLGEYSECITGATKAIEIDVEEWLAYVDRAFCNLTLENYQVAMEDYKIYLAHSGTNPTNWYNLGYAQYHSGMNEDAVVSYSKTLELDPSYYQANINRGLAYVGLKKYDEALDDFNRALEYAEIPFAYAGRGDAYYGLKKYDLAIADYEKAISMLQGTSSSAHSYCMIAINYYEVGRYQDAIDAAKTGYELNPSCGGQKALEIQARSYYALGDYEQAILYMNKTLQQGEYALGYYYRGIMYQAAGKYEEARSDLNFFLENAQNDPNVADQIADAKARLTELTP